MESDRPPVVPSEFDAFQWRLLWQDEELRSIEFSRLLIGAFSAAAGFLAWSFFWSFLGR